MVAGVVQPYTFPSRNAWNMKTRKTRFYFSNRFLSSILLVTCLSWTAVAQEIVDSWQFTLRRPADGWQTSDFDTTEWKVANGGFGTVDTPNARVGTVWNTKGIWLRKAFELKSVPEDVSLLIHHDEDAEVFINGKLVATLKGFSNNYEVIPIPVELRAAFQVGKNLLAAHCSQTAGGQFIDVHVVDPNKVPELPPAKRDPKPFQSELITKWGSEVTAENAWTEYPRPQLQRDHWTNLNGNWDYAITPVKQVDQPKDWAGKILVPFCLESKLGGAQYLLDGSEALWYHRTFNVVSGDNAQTLLNFEAVDYRCEVFINGTSVGKHIGGNTPFSFDITKAAKVGANELVVRVEDDTEKYQLRGKQTLNARGIWYTQVSGIWQTVWIERVSKVYIQDLIIATNAEAGTIAIKPIVAGSDAMKATVKVKVIVRDGDTIVAQGSGTDSIQLKVANAKLWTPSSPHLYSMEATLADNAGKVVDRVQSYAGIRTVGKVKDADGHWRFTLNGNIIFHWGPLDQGWWPDGLLTPPSDEAMLFDIQWLKEAGFNMIRKHIKIEPRRYYFHCDRLGMMVWQDQVSGGVEGRDWPKWTRLQPNPIDAQSPDAQHAQWMLELERMIDHLENYPSIVCWVPFNEAWGQHRTVEVGEWTAKRDPSRLVNIASGGNFWPAGDIVDEHHYPHPNFPFELDTNGRFDNFVKVIGEFGGHGLPVQGHLWDANLRNWGYGDLPKTEAEYKDRYVASINMLDGFRARGIAAGIYTQTTDVEGEINGLMTYDRKVIKIPAKDLADLHKILFLEKGR